MSLNACLAYPEFDTIASFSVYAFALAWVAKLCFAKLMPVNVRKDMSVLSRKKAIYEKGVPFKPSKYSPSI